MIKRSVLREDTTILNVCVPNNRPLNYMRQKLIELQREINESIFMVGDFNIYLPEMDRLQGENYKAIAELNSIINQLDIIDIYRLLHPITEKYTFFSSSLGTFAKMDHVGHVLGHETHLTR